MEGKSGGHTHVFRRRGLRASAADARETSTPPSEGYDLVGVDPRGIWYGEGHSLSHPVVGATGPLLNARQGAGGPRVRLRYVLIRPAMGLSNPLRRGCSEGIDGQQPR